MSSVRERIEGLKRYGVARPHDRCNSEKADGSYLLRSDVLEAVAEAWQSERPREPGKYWVAIDPSNSEGYSGVHEAEIKKSRLMYGGLAVRLLGMKRSLQNILLDGALWLPRTTPQDPFAGRGE